MQCAGWRGIAVKRMRALLVAGVPVLLIAGAGVLSAAARAPAIGSAGTSAVTRAVTPRPPAISVVPGSVVVTVAPLPAATAAGSGNAATVLTSPSATPTRPGTPGSTPRPATEPVSSAAVTSPRSATAPKPAPGSAGPSAAGNVPTAPGAALPTLVAPFDTVLVRQGSGKVAHLTFDDGPGPQTGAVLDILAGAGVRATFCQVGSQLQDFPDTERRILREGHTLCNHSWSHPDRLGAASAREIDSQVGRTQRAFTALRVAVHYFRAPGGSFGGEVPTLRQVCQVDGVVPLGWSVDSEDWRKPGRAAIVANVLTEVRPGAIILMHDAGGADRDQTIAALPVIIGELRAAGYTLTPLPAQGIG